MSDIKTKVDSAIADNKIAVFWRPGCGPSSSAKNTLDEENYPGVSRAYVQLSSGDETHAYLKERSKAQNGGKPYTTFPYVWINQEFIGGNSDLSGSKGKAALSALKACTMSADAQALVNHMISSNQIAIFTQSDCIYCERAIEETSSTHYPKIRRDIFESAEPCCIYPFPNVLILSMSRLDDPNIDTETTESAEIRAYLREKYGQSAVPYVFISKPPSTSTLLPSSVDAGLTGADADREFIGGSDALHDLHEAGRLEGMLKT
ncbi:hypothetical protein HWV62_33893 [Athelia sp. TMB]|nr:hypothetical protein HWV62_33893 [Athelia sp. TMB]